ncbi:MAG: DUF3299 domain-containing protein [Fimbriimonas sp.]
MKLLALVLVVVSLPALAGQNVRKIDWPDLVPPMPEFKNPFDKLPTDQVADLILIARVRDIQREKRKPAADQVRQATEARQRLKKKNVDSEKLLAERERIMQIRAANATSMVNSLDGETIQMGGYLLPLEFDGTNVTEFLLVPWVGACIHTPPPNPNQILYVKTAKPFEAKDRYEPVRITGKLTVKSLQKKLYLVDGSSAISMGYSLAATDVVAINPQ